MKSRRKFLKTAVASAIGALALGRFGGTAFAVGKSDSNKPFNTKFAPNFDQFKAVTEGFSFSDKLKFMYDQGFRAIEDNAMKWRPVEAQEEIAKTMDKLGMEMGVFVAMVNFDAAYMSGNRMDMGNPNRDKNSVRYWIKNEMASAVETGKRINAKWATIVLGREDPTLEPEYQMANAIENLKYAADIAEKNGLILVMEPLPDMYLRRIPQAYALCKAVNSPSCKILDDLYQQQIAEGNLINNMDKAWDEIAYFQIADLPGRNEPGTGEINYKNIIQYIWNKGYRGVVGMEHGQSDGSKEGDLKLIETYRAIDSIA